MTTEPETLLEDTDPASVFTVRLSVADATNVIEDALQNDSLDDFKSLVLGIFGLLIDASAEGSEATGLDGTQ